ncbi:hypothetical protein BUZ03_13420, partial [Staphylococcus gallinarum]
YKQDVGFYFDINEVGRFPEAALNETKLATQLTRVGAIDYSQMISRLMKNDKSNSSENILKYIFTDNIEKSG